MSVCLNASVCVCVCVCVRLRGIWTCLHPHSNVPRWWFRPKDDHSDVTSVGRNLQVVLDDLIPSCLGVSWSGKTDINANNNPPN